MVLSQVESRNQYRTTDVGIPALSTYNKGLWGELFIRVHNCEFKASLRTGLASENWPWNLRHQCSETENPQGEAAGPACSHLDDNVIGASKVCRTLRADLEVRTGDHRGQDRDNGELAWLPNSSQVRDNIENIISELWCCFIYLVLGVCL